MLFIYLLYYIINCFRCYVDVMDAGVNWFDDFVNNLNKRGFIDVNVDLLDVLAYEANRLYHVPNDVNYLNNYFYCDHEVAYGVIICLSGVYRD